MSTTWKTGLVSVVVPSYNYANYLDRRIESLITQTYQNLEIIVIDDCSKDDSAEVLRKYENHPKVKVVLRKENGGWISTNNMGVELSSGEFVIFAQCDDDCDPRMIQRLVEAMNTNPSAGIAFCRSHLTDEDGKEIGNDFLSREKKFRDKCATDALIPSAEMGRFLLYACVIPNLSAALIRRECFSTVGNFSLAYPLSSDWDWYFNIAARYDVAYVAESLNYFRQHENTIRSLTKERVAIEDLLRLLLGRIALLNLTFLERCRFRTRIMFLWGYRLFSHPLVGIRNFPYHLKIVFQVDKPAVLFFVPGLMLGVFKIIAKLASKLNPAHST